jgi:hypothetical protein
MKKSSVESVWMLRPVITATGETATTRAAVRPAGSPKSRREKRNVASTRARLETIETRRPARIETPVTRNTACRR